MATVPPDVSLDVCISEASAFVKSAKAEIDGCEHPAIIDLVHGCDWLLAALEAVAKKLKETEHG